MLQSPLLAACPGLLHGFSDRDDGNIAFHVGDDPERVHAAQQRLARLLGYDRDALVPMRQVHGCGIVLPADGDGYDHPPECDALITDRPRQPLMVMVADCIPLLLYDPLRKVIAAVHAGRAGAFENIAGKTVRRMEQEYGSQAEAILAVLGPSIKVCCYELGEAIAAEAEERGYGDALQQRKGRWHLDISAIVVSQLKEAGVNTAHIDLMPHCTACGTERFFSYRAEGKKSGRFAGVIMLR